MNGLAVLSPGYQMGRFSLLVNLHCTGSADNDATPSRFMTSQIKNGFEMS